MPTYRVSLGERTHTVALRQEGDQLLARVDDGPEQPVELASVRGPLRSLRAGSRRWELLAERSPENDLLLALGGHDLRAQVLDEAHARLAEVAGAHQAGHARTELKAPMPGLVVRVLCRPGDTIQGGQPLVVLQAMKMENELSVGRGGVVKSVSVAEGQTVELGQALVVLE